MISSRNKSISFFLAAMLSLISWIIIFVNIILRFTTLFAIGLYSVDTIGFIFVTILLSIYTIAILFKLSTGAFFPIILMLLHMATLNGSTLAIFFIVIDLIIMILLNTGSIKTEQPTSTGSYSQYRNTYYSNNNTNERTTRSPLDENNVFDAEYKTKDK
ncbi:hypothetical protein LJB88_04420 [Erysipelotrichaceae bacterium OttesenSCG-928-M19]|nr:hypothetical protein [Erysipelotrichaceae bacterium OttesenSCG-928-M19]